MIIRSIGEVVGGRTLASVAPEDSVRAACDVLAKADVGAVAVMHDGNLVGILSERDVIRRCICKGRPTAETRVEEIMTAKPVTVEKTTSLSDAMRGMLAGKFRHLPVTEAGRVIAMLSMRDIPTEYRLMVERFEEYRGNTLASQRAVA